MDSVGLTAAAADLVSKPIPIPTSRICHFPSSNEDGLGAWAGLASAELGCWR